MQNCFLNHLCLLYQACGDRYIVHAPTCSATTVSKQLSLSSLDARLTICILIAYLQYFCVYIYIYRHVHYIYCISRRSQAQDAKLDYSLS